MAVLPDAYLPCFRGLQSTASQHEPGEGSCAAAATFSTGWPWSDESLRWGCTTHLPPSPRPEDEGRLIACGHRTSKTTSAESSQPPRSLEHDETQYDRAHQPA